jgi:hypothetical protein
MRGTRIKEEVEICATNLANKTKCVSTNAKKWGPIDLVCFPTHLRTETDTVSETPCFLFSRIPGLWKSSNTQ